MCKRFTYLLHDYFKRCKATLDGEKLRNANSGSLRRCSWDRTKKKKPPTFFLLALFSSPPSSQFPVVIIATPTKKPNRQNDQLNQIK